MATLDTQLWRYHSMDVFATYSTDLKKEADGVWRDCPGGGKVLIARAGNRKYSRMLADLYEKNQRALDVKGDAADELSDKIMIDVMAHTVLLGWDGITFKKQALPVSPENAALLLGVKDFRLLIARLSNEIDSYRAAEEAVLGES